MNLFFSSIYLAWADTRARYKKSVLGPLWLTLTSLIGVLGLSIVWSNLLQEDQKSFIPSLSIGLMTWQMISGILNDAPGSFIRFAHIIRNIQMPLWFFTIRSISKHLINFIHNLIIPIGVIWYFDLPIQAISLLSLIGLALVMGNLYWITYVLGFIGSRFRDIEWAIQSMIPLLFFISPVIFRPDRLPQALNIIWLNPLSYFIEAIRAPLLGQIPSMNTYIILVGMLLSGMLLMLIVKKRCAQRLPFWI
jgi:ABC-type polysaccharide/polyol phosphate export permease